jgi:hypothetical protein
MIIFQILAQAARIAAAQTFGKHPYWYGTLWGVAIVSTTLWIAGI